MLLELKIFLTIWIAMIATSMWEASVEGKNYWDKGKNGWKWKVGKYVLLTRYHFFLFGVAYPALLSLIFVIYGFNLKLFGIILSAYASGMILEDFFWFVFNPFYGIKKFNSKNVVWYPWIKIGKLEFPLSYVLLLSLSVISWLLLWK